MVDFYENMMLNILEHKKRDTDDADDAADNFETAISSRSASPENDVDDILESFSADRYTADVTLSRLFSLESEKYAFEVISGAAYLNRFVLPLSSVKYESLMQGCVRSENDSSNNRKLKVVETFLEDPATYKFRPSQIQNSRDALVHISRDRGVHKLADQTFSRSCDYQPSTNITNIETAPDPRLFGANIGTNISASSSSDATRSPAATDVNSCMGNGSTNKCNSDLIELFCNARGYSYDFRHISQPPLSDILKCELTGTKNDSNSSVMINVCKPEVGSHHGLIKNHSLENAAHTELNNICSRSCEAGSDGLDNTIKLIDISKQEYNQSSNGVDVQNSQVNTKITNDLNVTSGFVTDSDTNQTKSSAQSHSEWLLIPETLNDISLNDFIKEFDSVNKSNLLSDDLNYAVKFPNKRDEENNHDVTNISSVNLDSLNNECHHSKNLNNNARHSDGFVVSYLVTPPSNRRSLLDDVDSYKSCKLGLRSNLTDVAAKVCTLRSTGLFGSVDSLRSSTGSSQCSNFVDDHSIEEILECALENLSDMSDGDQSCFSTLPQKLFQRMSSGITPVTFAHSVHNLDGPTGETPGNLKLIVSAEPFAPYPVSQAVTLAAIAASVHACSEANLIHYSRSLPSSDCNDPTLSVSNAPPCVSNSLSPAPSVQYSISNVPPVDSKEPNVGASSLRHLPVAIVNPSIISRLSQRAFTNLHPTTVSGIHALQNDRSTNLATSEGNCLSSCSYSIPPIESQSRSGYFPSVSQICSDCFSRSSSCEANIGDDEEDPKLSGTESSSDVFPDENFDDSTFECGITPRVNWRTTSSKFVQPETLNQVALRKTQKRTSVQSDSSLTDTLSDSTSRGNELTLAVLERSTNDPDLTSDEDQEVSNLCSPLRCPGDLGFVANSENVIGQDPGADNYDNDVDSSSTVTSGPESDAITGSDIDQEDIKLDRYVIRVPSFQTTSQFNNNFEDNSFIDPKQVYRASVDKFTRLPNRWSSENRLSKLYIYEYIEDEDTTCSDVVDHSDDLADVGCSSPAFCNNLNTNAEDVHTAPECTKLQEDSPSGQNIAVVRPTHSKKHNSKGNNRSRRHDNYSRESNLQSDTFLSRLEKYQIVPTLASKPGKFSGSNSLLSLGSCNENTDRIDITMRGADNICVQPCASDSFKLKNDIDLASPGADMGALSSGIITVSMDTVLPTEVVVFTFLNESVGDETLSEPQTFKLLTPKELQPVSC